MTFGTREAFNREGLYRLITTTKQVDGYTAELMNREYYETHYGIFDHNTKGLEKTKPLALVAMHKAENTYSYSLLRRYLWRYRHHEIQKNWGLSLAEFMDLPWAIGNDLFNIEQMVTKIKGDEERQRQLEQELALKRASQGKNT